MRLPRLKLSVGTLLIAVAAFALGIWADRARNRYIQCMERAGHYRSQASGQRKQIRWDDSYINKFNNQIAGGVLSTDEVRRLREDIRPVVKAREWSLAFAAYCEAMCMQFERAAFLQYLPLPDETESSPAL